MSETLEEYYNHILDIKSPWEEPYALIELVRVTARFYPEVGIQRDSKTREVTAIVEYKDNEPLLCPECREPGKLYDHRIRTWRHLDTCNHKTLVRGNIPRVDCSVHGVRQVAVLWAEKNSRFTLEFESTVILWLKEDPISTVAENFGLSWDEVDGIMARAIHRGLARRKKTEPKNIGIDETSFQKRHEYVTVILDKDKDVIIDILDDRKAETLKNWFKTQEKSDFMKVESISMDMWDPFINAVNDHFTNAKELIAFNRFHVAQHFSKALDKIRAEEHRFFVTSLKNDCLTRSRYQWLKNSGRNDNRATRRKEFLCLTRMNLKTARACIYVSLYTPPLVHEGINA